MHNGQVTQTGQVTGRISNFMARVFGCRHAELSRPCSRGGRAYRSCVNCGAQRHFHLGNWQMQGNFYYGKPLHSLSHSTNSLSN